MTSLYSVVGNSVVKIAEISNVKFDSVVNEARTAMRDNFNIEFEGDILVGSSFMRIFNKMHCGYPWAKPSGGRMAKRIQRQRIARKRRQ